MTKISVILVDDHPVVRSGIRSLLERAKDIVVLAEADNGEKALRLVQELQPHVLLLDMEIPNVSGVEVAKQLKSIKSPVKVIALSAYDDIQYVRNLLASGAAGYLVKEEAPEMIIDAVRGVARGEEGWISRKVAAKMSTWTRESLSGNDTLSVRELEVLQIVAAGKTNQEIARELRISEKTVEKHVGSILSKMNAASRVEAAVMAVQRGLV